MENNEVSIDYNKKFKELNNKISRISQETKENARIQNNYFSYINNIQQKCNKRFSNVDKGFNQIKNEFIRLINTYDTNQNTKHSNNQLQYLTQNIQTNLQEQRDSLCQYIDSVFNSITNEIISDHNVKVNEKKKLLKEAIEIKNEVTTHNKEIEMKITLEKSKMDKVINDIRKESCEEMQLVLNQIQEEQNIKTENKETFIKNCKKISGKIDEEFKRERKKREEFETNIFDLIDETCYKLSETS